MSSQQSMNNFIVNPKTGRLIKKFSKTHKKLIASGLLDEPISKPDENILIEANTPEEAKTLQSKMNKKAHVNKVITRRGTKVLKANRRPTRKETIDKISALATDTVIENKTELLEQDMTDQEIDSYIRNLILLKLSGHNTKREPETAPPSPKAISTRRSRFELE